MPPQHIPIAAPNIQWVRQMFVKVVSLDAGKQPDQLSPQGSLQLLADALEAGNRAECATSS
jgi:hypothetical protein